MLRKLAVASALAMASVTAFAADCEVTVNSTDQMTFDSKDIQVSKSCQSFTVNLTHSGNLPKNVMGHNLVITRTDDLQAVATEGAAQGVDQDYLKADDPRIVAHTRLIGGGEKDSVSFDVAKLNAGEGYSFFCSFPGHSAIMRGTVTLVD